MEKLIKRWVEKWFYRYYPERRIFMSTEIPALSSHDNNMFSCQNKFTETIIVDIRLKNEETN